VSHDLPLMVPGVNSQQHVTVDYHMCYENLLFPVTGLVFLGL